MQSTCVKTVLVLALVVGPAFAGFADEEKSSAPEQKTISQQEKAAVTQEKAVAKAESDSTATTVEMPKQEASKEETASKSLTGEVAGISPSFIAVTYGQDSETSYEMAFNLDAKVKIMGAKELKEILMGDTVSVSYDEKFQKDEKGNVRINGRQVNVITLVRPGNRIPEKEEAPAPAAPEETPQEGSQE